MDNIGAQPFLTREAFALERSAVREECVARCAGARRGWGGCRWWGGGSSWFAKEIDVRKLLKIFFGKSEGVAL